MTGVVLVVLIVAVPVLAIGFLALVVTLVVRQVAARRRRDDATVAWAAARGWTLSRDEPDVGVFSCRPMRAGGRPSVVVRGATPDGRPLVVLQWSRWERSSSSTTTAGGDSSASYSVEIPTTIVGVMTAPAGPDTAAIEIRRGGRRERGTTTVLTGVPAVDTTCTVTDPAIGGALLPPDVLARIAPTLRQGAGVLRQGAWLVADRSGALDPPAAEALLGLLHRVVDDLERHRAATA